MQNNTENHDELKDAPNLKAVQGREPFKAPEGYFGTLASNVQDKISASSQSQNSTVFIKRPAFLFAVVLMLGITSAVLINNYNTEKPVVAETVFTYDDMIESGYYTEIDENLLAENISVDQKNTEESSLEDYLLTNTDETLLTNDLNN